MGLKESNEITVKIKGELDEFYKIIQKKDLRLTTNFLWMIHISYRNN